MHTIHPMEKQASVESERLVWLDRPMSRAAFAQWLGQPASHAYYIESESRCVALMMVAIVADEVEIIDWGVDPAQRNNGIGSQCLASLLGMWRNAGLTVVHLDVRENNRTAVAVYTKCGFAVVGRRRKYYSNGDDAVMMKVIL